MITVITHMAASRKGIAVMEGPYNRLIQLSYFCDMLRVQKAVVNPVKVDDICIFDIFITNDRSSKPGKRERRFQRLQIPFGPNALKDNCGGRPAFLKQICAEFAYFRI